MTDSQNIKNLLNALYSHVPGDLAILGDEPDSVYQFEQWTDVQEIIDLHSTSNSLSFDLRSSETIGGVVLVCAKKDDAYTFYDKVAPHVVVTSEKATRLVYLTDADPKDTEKFLVECRKHETDDFYVTDCVPLPSETFTVAEIGEHLPWTAKNLKALFAKPKAEVVISKLHDADVYGEIPADVLDLPVQISTGKNQEDKVWKTTPSFPFSSLLKNLTTHVVGEKNGICFVTGSLADKRRTKNAVTGLYLMGLDVDSGASMDTTFQRLRDMGLFCVLYTTHSHGKNQITIKQDKFYRFMKDEHPEEDVEESTEWVKKFLTHEGKYIQSVIDTAEYVATQHVETGIMLVVNTRPFDRFRIIFPLAEPYIIAKQGKSQNDAVKHWSSMILGLGKEIGIAVDKAATDPSRLFFLPRHKKGDTNYRALINGEGKLLDWHTIKLTGIKDLKELKEDPFEQAAANLGARGKGRIVTPKYGIDLMKWAFERGDGFEISRVFQTYADDRMRGETSNGKFTVECPYDDDHSNPGDPEDMGCYIQDAGGDADQFQFRCSHDSCQGRDRLQMLCKAIELEWFPEEVITDDDFDNLVREPETGEESAEDAPESDSTDKPEEPNVSSAQRLRDALKKADALSQQSSQESIDEVIALCVPMSQPEQQRILALMAGKLKMTKTVLEGVLKDAMKRASAGKLIDDKVYDPKEAAAAAKSKFKSLLTSKKPIVVIQQNDQVATCVAAVDALNLINRGRPEKTKQTREGTETVPAVLPLHLFYRYAELPVRVVESADGNYRPETLTDKVITSICKDHLELIEVDDNSYSRPLIPKWIADMVVADPKLDCLPLEGFSTLPYFTADYRLETKNGYNEFSRRILSMDKDVAERLADPKRTLIKLKPTLEDVKQAWHEIFEFTFADFPFHDGEVNDNGRSSRSHLLSMMLQPIVRSLINGPTPIYLVDKPAAGTGASLLCETAMLVALGRALGTMAMPEHDDEIRKGISTAYSNGEQCVFFDNIVSKVQSPFFANLATAPVWNDRMLGSNTMISVKNTMQAIFAGNNVDATEENLRRMLLIRMDFQDDPTLSDRKFKVADLKTYVEENKLDLFCHLLTFVNYWISKGAPAWTGKPLTGFESYCRVMGGILEACEIEGFLENRVLYSNAANQDKLAWAGFLQEIISKKGLNKPQSIGDLASLYCNMPSPPMLVINGGYRVTPSDDEGRVSGQMDKVINKQIDQVFRIFYKGAIARATIKRSIDRERGQTLFSIVMLDDEPKEQAA